MCWLDLLTFLLSLCTKPYGAVLATFFVSCGAQYDWMCSTQDNLAYLPDIPLSGGLTVPASSNRLFVYEVPGSSLNCGGRVIGVEYCYGKQSSGDPNTENIFSVLILNKLPNPTPPSLASFSVLTSAVAPNPDTPCTPVGTRCCSAYNFTEQFALPEGDFALGVLTSNSQQRIHQYHDSETQYVVAYHNIFNADGLSTAPNSMVNIGTQPITNQGFVNMQLVISQESDPTTSTGTLGSTTATTITDTVNQATTPTSDATEAPTSRTANNPSSDTTSGVGDTPPPTTSSTPIDLTTSTPHNTAATSAPQAMPDSLVSTAVGVAVGLAVPLVLLCMGVVVIVMCIRKNRTDGWKPKPIPSNESMLRHDGFDNVLYGSEVEVTVTATGARYTSMDSHDYASADGTQSSNTKDSDLHEYATADELRNSDSKKIDGVPEYSYASMNVNRISRDPPQLPPSTGSRRPKSSISGSNDVIYMAPANDENSLYAQFSEMKISVLSHSAIDLKEKLGAGQFGTVHKAELKINDKSSKMVAVKTLNKGSTDMDRVKFLQEAAIMGQFKHPNVVKMYGVATQEEPIMIVLELLSTGDLRNHLLKSKEMNNSEVLDVHTLLSYCRQVASGMSYLSNKAFIHRDLAARNILVSDDGVCKIADFGMSRDLMDEDYYISHGGKIPVRWTAPEAIHFKKYSTASDVWSFGCVMYEIWSLGHKPFEAFSNNQTIAEVEEGYRLAPPPGTPRTLYQLMIECWHPVKAERPMFTDLMQRLSLPDTKLLKWTEEDKKVHPQACVLGAQLHFAEDLYAGLQNSYTVSNKNVGSYEEPVHVNIPV